MSFIKMVIFGILYFAWIATLWCLKLMGLAVIPMIIGGIVGGIVAFMHLQGIGYILLTVAFYQRFTQVDSKWLMGFCIVGMIASVICLIQSLRSSSVKAVRISKSYKNNIMASIMFLVAVLCLLYLPSYEGIKILGNVKWQAYLIMAFFPLTAMAMIGDDLKRYQGIKELLKTKDLITESDFADIIYRENQDKESFARSYNEIIELFACIKKVEDISEYEGKKEVYYFQTPRLEYIRKKILQEVPDSNAITVTDWKANTYGEILKADFDIFARDLVPEVQWGNHHDCEVVTLAERGSHCGLCDACGQYSDDLIIESHGQFCSDRCSHVIEDLEEHFSKKVYADDELVKWNQLSILFATGLSENTLKEQLYYINKTQKNGNKSHGYAAEVVNDKVDHVLGKDAKIVGKDNARNGADRMVNGQLIQTKYHKTASSGLRDCFGDDGMYRYIDGNGKPMPLEVPKGQGEKAVQILAEKIKQGQVPGVTNPSEAANIIREGYFTYEQACNFTKFGTIESITFDFFSGVINCAPGIGLSSAVVFLIQVASGEDAVDAAKLAVCSVVDMTMKVGVSSMLTQQIAKTQIGTNVLAAFGEGGLKFMNAGIYLLVFSYRDFVDFFQGSISGGKLAGRLVKSGVVMGTSYGTTKAVEYAVSHGFKFLAKAAGPLGWGAGLLVGFLMSEALKEEPRITEKDATRMQLILTNQLQSISYRYLLTGDEITDVYVDLMGEDPLDILCAMRDNGNPYQYIGCEIFEKLPNHIHRKKIIEV